MNSFIETIRELAADAKGELPESAVTAAVCADSALGPQEIENGSLYLVPDGHGGHRILTTPGFDKANKDKPEELPRTIRVTDPVSLQTYLSAYNLSYATMRAHKGIDMIRVVVDDVDGYQMHQAELKLTRTPEWREWTAMADELVEQEVFAEFIEDHMSTISTPDAATLLDVCQTLHGTKNVAWSSGVVLQNGQQQFRWEEQVDARAGQKGDLAIPTVLQLFIAPFEGADKQLVKALFRFRIGQGGKIRMGVKLVDKASYETAAFEQIVKAASDLTGLTPIHCV